MPPVAEFGALEQATSWFATLGSDAVSARERAAGQRWLAGSSANRQASDRVRAISTRLALDEPERAAADAALDAASRLRRRGAMKALAVIAGAGAVGWGAAHVELWRDALADLAADHRTATGETRRIALADGTRLWLDTASALARMFHQKQVGSPVPKRVDIGI